MQLLKKEFTIGVFKSPFLKMHKSHFHVLKWEVKQNERKRDKEGENEIKERDSEGDRDIMSW